MAAAAGALTIRKPPAQQNPETRLFITPTDHVLITSTPFLGWRDEAAAGARPASKSLRQSEVAAAFGTRIILSPDPAHAAANDAARLFNFGLTRSAWQHYLDELVTSGLGAGRPLADPPALEQAMLALGLVGERSMHATTEPGIKRPGPTWTML